jgi:hypothetical protein
MEETNSLVEEKPPVQVIWGGISRW